jgi:hypothetical protein
MNWHKVNVALGSSPGGALSSAPDLASWGADRLDVTALGDTADIVHRTSPGTTTFSDEFSLGASIAAPYLAASAFCTTGQDCRVGDINGDGKDDIVEFNKNATRSGRSRGQVYAALSNGSTFNAPSLVHPFFCVEGEDCALGDVNGDNKDDLITFTKGTAGVVYVALSNGQSFDASTIWTQDFCLSGETCGVGDIDGDGKADIVSFAKSVYSDSRAGDVKVARKDIYNTFLPARLLLDDFCVGNETCQVGDVTGDGKADLVVFDRVGGVQVARARRDEVVGVDAPFQWSTSLCSGDEECQLGDVNGDGLADAVIWNKVSGKPYIGTSTGTAFTNTGSWGGVQCTQQCRTADVDGDHKKDGLAFGNDQAGNVTVALTRPFF